jgi:hypothetical protein
MKPLNMKNLLILIAILSLLLPSLSTAGSLSFGSFSPFSYYPNFYIPDTKVQKSVDEEDKRLGEARKTIKQYMQERSEGKYKIGEIEDRGTHYLTEIFGSGDKVKEVLIVDKQTNKIQSLK